MAGEQKAKQRENRAVVSLQKTFGQPALWLVKIQCIDSSLRLQQTMHFPQIGRQIGKISQTKGASNGIKRGIREWQTLHRIDQVNGILRQFAQFVFSVIQHVFGRVCSDNRTLAIGFAYSDGHISGTAGQIENRALYPISVELLSQKPSGLAPPAKVQAKAGDMIKCIIAAQPIAFEFEKGIFSIALRERYFPTSIVAKCA